MSEEFIFVQQLEEERPKSAADTTLSGDMVGMRANDASDEEGDDSIKGLGGAETEETREEDEDGEGDYDDHYDEDAEFMDGDEDELGSDMGLLLDEEEDGGEAGSSGKEAGGAWDLQGLLLVCLLSASLVLCGYACFSLDSQLRLSSAERAVLEQQPLSDLQYSILRSELNVLSSGHKALTQEMQRLRAAHEATARTMASVQTLLLDARGHGGQQQHAYSSPTSGQSSSSHRGKVLQPVVPYKCRRMYFSFLTLRHCINFHHH
jgi:hypothetical protein